MFGPLVSQSRGAVPDGNHAAFSEAVLLNALLHDLVVPMGVDADVFGKALAIIGNVGKQAVDLAVSGHTVNGQVRLVVQPAALLNFRIGLLRVIRLRI